MRIRKHAKISPLLYTTSSLNPSTHLHTHFCQLNQSPWDVMNFSPPSTPPPPPPPPPQVDENGAFAVNGSLRDCISVNKRDQWEYPGDTPAKSATVKAEELLPPPPAAKETITLCCKTDGKSWQCKNEAAEGNSLCQHHISQARSYNNGYHYMAKKREKKLSSETRRAVRTKKASTSSNPHEFYYYSGFGPRWGKNRGEALSITADTAAADTTAIGSNSNGSSSKNVEHEDEMGDDESDFYEFEEEEEGINKRDKNVGKKRGRKPIKARSLKSLM